MNEFHTSGGPSQMGSPDETNHSTLPHGRGDRVRSAWPRSERGATAVEYALMVTLIAVVIIGAVTLFGQNMIHLFDVPASAL